MENSWRSVNNGVMCLYLCVILMERWLKDLMCLLYLYSKKCGRWTSLKLHK
jgi:hypothetical protein